MMQLVEEIASISGIVPDVSGSAYQASKRGMIGLSHAVRVEEKEKGIRTCALCPGLVETELVAGIFDTEPVLDSYLTQMPLGRAGQPEEIADLVRFLAGPESSWITGQSVGIDGGHSLRRGPDYTPFAEPVYGADALRGVPPS